MSPARERLVAVLALILLGALTVLASTQAFAVVRLVEQARPLTVPGSQAAPALAPLGLAQLALAGALTIAGPVARRVLGVVLVLLGAAVLAELVPLVADPTSGARGAIDAATGVTDAAGLVAGVAGTAWPVVGVVAGAASAAAGVAVLVRAGRWSTGGRRFRQQQRAAPVRSVTDPVSEWDALSRGGDPTDPTDAVDGADRSDPDERPR